MDLTQNAKNVQEESEKEYELSVCNKEVKMSVSHSCDGFSRTSVMEQAQEVQANLVSEAPSFTKTLTKSQVSGDSVRLYMPREFSRVHMPKVDTTIVLVDENENEYDIKHTVGKSGRETTSWLSDGWRSFCLAKKLVEEDVIVFQLIEPFKFKVYIKKTLENLYCHHAEAENNDIRDKKRQKCTESLVVNAHSKENSVLSYDDNCHSEIVDGIQLTKSIINFKNVKSFEDFSIRVNGLILNSDQISPHFLEKYFNLCCSQNVFLHDNLAEGCGRIFVTGIISETINIADAIRAAKSTTSLNQLKSWDKTLKAFEDLGMGVGFLRDRIHKLISLSNNARTKTTQRKKSVQDMKSAMQELSNILKLIKGLDADIKEHDSAFEEVSSASW